MEAGILEEASAFTNLIVAGAAGRGWLIWDQHRWNWVEGGLKEQLHGEFLPMGQSCLLVGECCISGWIVGPTSPSGFCFPWAPPKPTLTTVCLCSAHNGAFFWPTEVRKVCTVTTADVTVLAGASGHARLAQRHAGPAGATGSRAGSESSAIIYASCLAQA